MRYVKGLLAVLLLVAMAGCVIDLDDDHDDHHDDDGYELEIGES